MLPSSSGSFPLFRIFGIQVYLHWWWFLFAAVELMIRRNPYSSFGWKVAEYLSVFVIVLLHEFGHALACRQTGGKADQIILWPLGGVAFVKPPPRPGAELWSIAAGPLVNVLLIPVLLGAMWARTQFQLGDASVDVRVFLVAVFWINLGLLIFNMLPVYPLDGGQILRSLLWYGVGRARSLYFATITGFVGIAVIAAYFIWSNPNRALFVLLMGGFLASQCLASFRHAQALLQLEKLPRHAGVKCPECGERPPGGPIWACGACGNRFDPFSTQGVCPHCATVQPTIPCLHCGTASTRERWGIVRAGGAGAPPVIDV